jgi:hypothetical protein
MRPETPMTGGPRSGRSPAVLADLVGPDQVLLAHCVAPGCGAAAVIELGAWRQSQIRLASVARLEDELRCACGARRGALSARAYWGPRPATHGRLFLFNA